MVYYPVDWEEGVRRECRRRRYSEKTARSYVYCISKFLDWAGKDLGKIGKKDVREFLTHLSEKELSGSSMNVYHMAIRFLFENVLEKRMWIDIKYSKVPEKLPLVLTKDEVGALLASIVNEKHKLMIGLLYSAGLRVSELLNLMVCDIDLDRNYGFVREGKGGKDRFFILSERLKPRIRELIYNEGLNGESFLFQSNRGKKYHQRSIQLILRDASLKSKIGKKVHPHTLRHSFATHLIEQGNSVSDVQALLGHKSPETTMVYVHTASPNMIKIKSPLDYL